jgi:hypothetical protein
MVMILDILDITILVKCLLINTLHCYHVDSVMWVWGLKSTNLSRDVLSDLDEPLLGCSVNSYFLVHNVYISLGTNVAIPRSNKVSNNNYTLNK